jgi:hypothetical protein
MVAASSAQAATVHFEGFEDPAWTAGQPGNWQNFSGGEISRVPSGTNGVASSSGSAHAVIGNLSLQPNVFGAPSLGANSPYTQLGGYSSTFGTGFIASLDVYLDPNWADGQGFDYSVAANNQGGAHLRDFMFHVGVVAGDLLVNASNNTDKSFNAFKLENENGGDNYTVTQAGWYTLEHVFYELGGFLAVDLNLLDDGGAVLHSITRTTTDSIATTVGGNRYGWLTYNNIEGLAVDNTVLRTSEAPEPSAIGLLGVGLAALAFAANRRRKERA